MREPRKPCVSPALTPADARTGKSTARSRFIDTWAAIRAWGRQVLDAHRDGQLDPAAVAVAVWVMLVAVRIGAVTGIEARLAGVTKMTGHSERSASRGLQKLCANNLLVLTERPKAPTADHAGRAGVYRLVIDTDRVEHRPPSDDNDYENVTDIAGRYVAIATALGKYCGPGGQAAWTVILYLVGEALTWGRVEMRVSTRDLGLSKSTAAKVRVALGAIGHGRLRIVAGTGHQATLYSLDAGDAAPVHEHTEGDPRGTHTDVQLEQRDVCSTEPLDQLPADAGEGSHTEEWPLTTDEVIDTVIAKHGGPVTKPIRALASRLSKSSVTKSDLRIYLDEYERRAPQPDGTGAGWVTARLREVTAHHLDVAELTVLKEPTRDDAQRAYFTFQRALVVDMPLVDLAALQRDVLLDPATPPAVAHRLREARDPYIAIEDPYVLNWVADINAQRSGVPMTAWVDIHLADLLDVYRQALQPRRPEQTSAVA